MNTPDILKKILSVKKSEITERQRELSLADVKHQAIDCGPTRGFKSTLVQKIDAGKAGIIAEIKKASPSKGLIRPDFHPSQLAESYQEGGATCLSVLTDVSFFQGADEYLKQARAACNLPVLRKDFTIDPWQIYEARMIGADAVLLIVAALEKNQLEDLYEIARELGLDVLVEVHNEDELALALPLSQGMLGINNRNLHTFETSLTTTYNLLQYIPEHRMVITESGISAREDIIKMFEHQVKAFLIGESFMRAENPGKRVSAFFEGYL